MQEDFDRLLKLIENQNNKIVLELLSYYKSNEITYSTFENDFRIADNKSHILNIYQSRWKFEKQRENNQFVFGYEELIPKLTNTNFNSICISTITSNKGSYIIFTDNNKTEFIGILKSKRTLEEIREKYFNHKKTVEDIGEKVIYDYESNEIIFENGVLKEKNSR